MGDRPLSLGQHQALTHLASWYCGSTVAEMRRACGDLLTTTTRRRLDHLRRRGLIEISPAGRWAITRAGRRSLQA